MSVNKFTTTPAGTSLRFSVTDTGIGIPKDKHHRLFQHFSQVDGSIQRDFGGTGLGLAICKRLVELMGGDIGVVSDAGQGSTFWFTVTLPEATLAEARTPWSEDAGQARRGHLLLVEDVEVNQDLARIILEAMGHTVDVISDGASAVEAVRQGRYDLVLMDVQMPGMDGLTATRLIRRLDPAVARVPIVAMTANVLPHQVRSFRDAGMDDHVGKPFKRTELGATIQKWLANGPVSTDGEAVAGDPSDFDAPTFTDLAGCIEAARMVDILNSYIATVEAYFSERPRNAVERSITRGHAHSLCSSAGILGFRRLSAICRSVDAFTEDQIDVEGSARFDDLITEAQDAAIASSAHARRLILDLDGSAVTSARGASLRLVQ